MAKANPSEEEASKLKETRETMPSAHYEQVAISVGENMKLLGSSLEEVKPESRPVWNIGVALLALSDAIQDEFVHLNTQLEYLKQQINR